VSNDHVKTTYDAQDSSGSSGPIDFFDDLDDDIAHALLDMHRLMSAAPGARWNTVRFLIERNGRFHVDYGSADTPSE